MTDKQENPPAFPTHNGLDENNRPHGGMTLLDWQAGHAPIGLAEAEQSLAAEGRSQFSHAEIYKRLAQMRYAYADAMLAERARRKP